MSKLTVLTNLDLDDLNNKIDNEVSDIQSSIEQSVTDTKAYVDEALNNVSTIKDWNQNDETAPDYIKNRTHYEGVGDTILHPEVTVTLDDEYGTLHNYSNLPLFTEGLVVGESYTVVWDGTRYETIAVETYNSGERVYMLGNGALCHIPDAVDNGLPFYLDTFGGYNDKLYWICASDEYKNKSVTFSILKKGSIIVQLDEKFIPDTIARKSDIDNVNIVKDWNQNDETAADYIKNRTHYDAGELIHEFPMSTTDLQESDYFDMMFRMCGPFETFNLTEPDFWIGLVLVSNTSGYSCIPNDTNYVSADNIVSLSDNGSFAIRWEGRHSAIAVISEADVNVALPLPTNNGTFNVTYPSAGLYVTYYSYNGPAVTQIKWEDIVPLDEKFIPDTIARTEYVDESLANFSGGVSSWNDLKDKPFYEEIVMGDTLTWDRNTTGHLMIMTDDGRGNYYNIIKISDAVPTIDDCSNGIIETTDLHPDVIVETSADELQSSANDCNGMMITNYGTFIVPSDNFTFNFFNFPEAGIWLCDHGAPVGFDSCPSTITIPGYNGFANTTIKLLDEKFIPEYSPSWSNLTDRPFYDNITSLGNTLRWSGDTTGLVTNIVDKPEWYKISDNVPSIDDIKNGGALQHVDYRGNTGSEILDGDWAAEQLETAGYFIVDYYAAVITEDNTNAGSYGIFPEKGIYFVSIEYGFRGASFTINDYEFTISDLKPLDPKYLPDTVASKEYVDQEIAKIQVNINNLTSSVDEAVEELSKI